MAADDDSSSEIEFVERTTPSPIKPRRSARERKAPRSKDEFAAPAAAILLAASSSRSAALQAQSSSATLSGHDDDNEDATRLNDVNKGTGTNIARVNTLASTSKVTLDNAYADQPRPVKSKPSASSSVAATTTTTSSSAPNLAPPQPAPPTDRARTTSVSRSPAPPTAAPSAAAGGLRKPKTATASLHATASLPSKARNSSSDEADDFFARKRPAKVPAAMKKAPRIPGRKPGATATAANASRPSSPTKAAAHLDLGSSSDESARPGPSSTARRPSSPIARPGSTRLASAAASAAIASSSSCSPVRRPTVPSDSDSDEDSDASGAGGGGGGRGTGSPSGSDPENLFSSSAVRPKSLKLPEWARGGIVRYSGADLERMKKGTGKNRKRKRLDVDSSDENDDDDDRKGKGPAGARKTGLGAFDGMGGSLWEKQLAATKAAEAAAAAAAAANADSKRRKGAGGFLGQYGDDGDGGSVDSDDSIEAEFAIYKQPAELARTVSTNPRKQRSSMSASSSSSPVRRAGSSSVGPSKSPIRTGGSLRSPRKVVEARKAAAELVITSGDEDDEEMRLGSDAGPNDEEEEEQEAGYMPNIERIRSMMDRSASAEHRSPSAPIPGAFPPLTTGSSNANNATTTTMGEKGPQIAIKLKMVFDPTRNVPEVAKRAYERLETFSIGLDESFSSLFYELAVRRTIPRDDLIITHCRTSHVSTPLTLARQTQVYEFGTPASLGLGLDAESAMEMRGYTRDVWEKCKAQERAKRIAAGGDEDGVDGGDDDDYDLEAAAAAAMARRSAGPRKVTASGVLDLGSSSDSGMHDGGAASSSSDPAAPNLDGLFPLTIRGSATQSLSLAVKPSTTMAQLLRAYCKQFKLGGEKALVLEFEGETLEATRTIEDVKEEFDLDGEETFDVKDMS
ncbi:hypothetical protein JCM10908_004847 [Rhodotorula pacifica]|uniref:uncharacterized protein n=1 Tax=Rhodotorula pacifica TaxID=1495444 RepID=UPI0031771C58